MNVSSCLLTLVLFLTLKESYSETTRQSNSKKILKKCCRVGDLLNVSGQCDVGTGAPKSWAPKVFFPKKKEFFDPAGTLPNMFSVKEEERPNCSSPELFKSSDIIIVANKGILIKTKHLTIEDFEAFCVDEEYSLICRNNNNEAVADNMTKRIELTKCCGPNEVYDSTSCNATNKVDPLFQSPNDIGYKMKFDFNYKFPDCGGSNEFAIAGLFLSNNYDLSTGNVKTESGKIFEREQFCLEHVYGPNEMYEGVKIFTCTEHFGTVPPTLTHQTDEGPFIVLAVGLLISVLFLIATLIVGFLLLSNHHMLHWRCQTNYVICLLIGDLLLAITQISGTSLHGPACIIFAHLMHFFFLATFFWLNTMCFNIWWTFR